jgi:hypothetical protein
MALTGMRAYQGSGWPTHIPGLLGPMLATFVMSALLAGGGGAGLLRRMFLWRVPIPRYLVALSPLAFFVLASLAQWLGSPSNSRGRQSLRRLLDRMLTSAQTLLGGCS